MELATRSPTSASVSSESTRDLHVCVSVLALALAEFVPYMQASRFAEACLHNDEPTFVKEIVETFLAGVTIDGIPYKSTKSRVLTRAHLVRAWNAARVERAKDAAAIVLAKKQASSRTLPPSCLKSKPSSGKRVSWADIEAKNPNTEGLSSVNEAACL